MSKYGLTLATGLWILRWLGVIKISYWWCLVPLVSEFITTIIIVSLVFIKILFLELYNHYEYLLQVLILYLLILQKFY